MMMRAFRNHRVLIQTIFAGVVIFLPACAIELIDDIIAERGVTWCETTQASDMSTSSTDSSETGETTLADTTSVESSTTGSTSTSESTEGGTGSSTEPESYCGDGIVDPDETCDDMNDIPDDGCKACARDSIVFITSELYQGNINGLDGADQRCRMRAAIAELPRSETYRAWISSSTTSAAERLIQSRGRYILVNGLVVAENWDALVSGTIEHPINVDENSQTQDYRAWTSTLFNGDAAPGANFCEDWTGIGAQGGTGRSSMTDETWSFFGNVPCAGELHLYCIEQ